MSIKHVFILILLISIIFSLNSIAATELNGTDNSVESKIISDDNSFEISENNALLENSLSNSISSKNDDVVYNSLSEDISLESDEYTIHVGKNITKDGNGSSENPYATFDLACSDVSSGKGNVIINVEEGTYYLDSPLIFNVNNLHIIGINKNVCIKYRESTKLQFFSISSPMGNFTMDNILIDVSDNPAVNINGNFKFNIYKGDANLVTFNNCTFKNFLELLPYELDEYDMSLLTEPYEFNNCNFIYDAEVLTYYMIGVADRDVTFNNCRFNFEFSFIYNRKDPSFSAGYSGKLTGHNTLFNDCWFGLNGLPSVFYDNGKEDDGYDIGRYAIFSISENYLGNNEYEIIGKLIWNDGTTDGIEKLNPMIVNLSSNTGILNQKTVTLENGTFQVLYTSTSANNKIVASLDNAVESVEFKSISISLDSPIIKYGAKQNITVTLPSEYNGVIYVTVNGKTYNKTVEAPNLSTTINITDVLPVGTHPVNVTFNDNKQNDPTQAIYGFNTTTITVLGLPYEFNATVPETLYLGDNATVTLKLPEGATGNITVKVGENEAKTFNITDTISIGGFVVGDNIVNITYNGNEQYESQSIEKHVFASLKPTTLTADNVTTIYGVAKDLVVTLTSNGNVLANKNITIIVGTINKTLPTDDNGQVSVDISTLSPSTYTATISFEGDELYNKSSITTKVSVKENAKTENITLPEITAGKATTTTIKLPENATGNITVSIDGSVSSVVNLTNGSATITIPALTAGKHNITIAYSGDDKYAAFSQTSTVEVKEPAKPTPKPEPVKPAQVKKQATKIMAKNKKFKAKTKVKKYTITLKTKAGKAIKKVQVTIKIGKKTYKAKTNAKGKATFKIKKLTKKGKYKATIKFKGNKLYKACSKKVKITIKK